MKKINILILICLILIGGFSSSVVEAAMGNTIFTSDVIIDLPLLTENIYIESGSTCDNFSISGGVLNVYDVPVGETFVFKGDTLRTLELTSAKVLDIEITDSLFSGEVINEFKVRTDNNADVDYVIAVSGKNVDYIVEIDGVEIPNSPVNSGNDQELAFSFDGNGNYQTVEIAPPNCASHGLGGEAWSEGGGWIRFSCPAIGSGTDYGVDYDTGTGELSGYAWSENIGWISFNTSDLTGCPSGACVAEVDLQTGEISGWARILSTIGAPLEKTGGLEGWISLGGANYSLDVINGTPSEITGYAWGDDKFGWVSFNCSNANHCATSDYKVTIGLTTNTPPTATNLTVRDTSGESGLHCFAGNAPVYLDWTFTDPGDTQSAYQIQIDNNSNFNPPTVDSGKVELLSGTYTPSGLPFSTNYYWRVRVWDSQDAGSGWTNPSPTSFTTPSRWPQPDFSWDPIDPLAEQDVTFTNATNYCTGCSYSWDFGDGSPTSSATNPVHVFDVSNNYSVNLTATSGVGTCSSSDTVLVDEALPLPTWRETKPF